MASVLVEPIKITGLRDVQAALRSMDGELPKRIRVVLNEVSETVAGGARRRVPTRKGRARGSIKVASSQREARIKAGGGKASYYPWLDFGGAVGRKHASRRPFVIGGRYLYPTFAANAATIHSALEKSLAKLITDSGLDAS